MREGSHRYIILLWAACAILFLGASASYAMDPPHGGKFVCTDCHGATAPWDTSGSSIDDTPYNLMCQSCHNGVDNASMETHSYYKTGNIARTTAWTFECRNCHDPHYQVQYWTHTAEYPGGAKLARGKIVSIAGDTVVVNTLSDTNPGWAGGIWNGHYFQPNISENYLYKILDNTNNTIIANSTIKLQDDWGWTIAKPGDEFGIGNTSLIRTEIFTRFPVVNASGGTVDSTRWRPAKFWNATGSVSSLGANAGDYEAVCIVCHTLTKANNYGFAKHETAHSVQRGAATYGYGNYTTPGSSGDNSHLGSKESTDSTGTCFNVESCHTGHETGYEIGGAKCGECHADTNFTGTGDLNKYIQRDSVKIACTTGADSVWAHPKHKAAGLACDDCHINGMNPGTNDANVGDLFIDINFKRSYASFGNYTGRSSSAPSGAELDPGFGYNSVSSNFKFGAGPGNGNMYCETLYCHSDGGAFGAAPTTRDTTAWNDTGYGCNACHGNWGGSPSNQADFVVTNYHPKHIAGSGNYAYKCYRCHDQTVNIDNTIKSTSRHVDGIKNVIFSGVGTYQQSLDGKCTNLYCHSDGTTTVEPYSSPKDDALWNSAGPIDCGGCHNQASDTSDLTWSSPHTEHVNTSTYGSASRTKPTSYQITCNACHSTVTGDGSSIADTDWHVNQVANVVINATDFGGTFNGGTCSNVKCHSTDGHSNFVTAQWSDGSQGCAYCHGEAKAKATMEFEAKLSPAHAAHLGTAAGEYGDVARLANTITCGSCHKGTTDDGKSLNTGGVINHLSFTNEVEIDIASINSSAGSFASGSCSNNYCHGTNMPFGSNVSITNKGTGMTPDWSDTDYINGTALNDCAQCHGFPPSQYTGYEGTDSTIHDKVGKDPDNCVPCHDHLNDENDWPTKGQWDNIAKHIDGVVQYTSCSGCHGQPPVDSTTVISNPEYTLMTAGAHKAHLDNGIGDETNECDVCHLGGGANGGHPYSYEITMGFMANVVGKATYQGASNINSVYNAGSGDDTTTEVLSPVDTNRYCNNIYCHSDGGDYGGNYSPKQANWDGGALGCGDCHGNGAQYVITNAHPKHVGGSGTNYSFDCRECHFETVDNTTPTVSNKAIHVDFIKNVVFYSGGLAQGSTYTKPTCDNSYCHSDANPIVVSRVYNTPAWNGSAACGTCHGADGTDMPVSAAHGKHLSSTGVYKFECEKCHSGIVTDSADSTDVPSIASTALHVDGFPNAVLNTTDPLIANALASWNGSTCSNVYCHSDGAGTPKTQAWSGSLDCSGCHDAAPTTGRHAKHLSAASGYQYECFECHNDTVEGDNITIIGNHVNKTPDVAWGNISSGGAAYSEPGNTCATIYCHGDGTGGYYTADWDVVGSGACGTCHGVDDSTMPASPSHILHVNTPSGNTYMYECDRCHYNIVSATANSTVAPVLLDNSVHVDGMSNVVLDTATIQAGGTGSGSAWDPATGKCTNTYCHGAGVGRPLTFGGGADTAPTWGNTSYIVGKYTGIGNTIDQDCAMCHGNPPDLGKHAGQTWKVASNQCNTCHDHLNNTSLWGTQGPWNDIAKHINGQADGGCDGCHGNPPVDTDTMIAGSDPPPTQREGQDFGGGPVPGWGAHARHWNYDSGFQNCYFCHSGGGSEESGSHPNASPYEVHMGFTYLTVSNNPAAVYNAPAFVPANYSLASSLVNTTVNTGGSARQCSGIYCHSDGGNYDKSSFVYKTPEWDDSFTYPDDCDQCHGDGLNTGNYVQSTMHPKHTGTYGYICQLCHNNVVNDLMDINNSLHVDGNKQFEFSSDSRVSDADPPSLPTCLVYCHTKGDDNTKPFGLPLNAAQWNAALPTDCTGCHGGDATVAVANRIDDSRLGAHGKHTNNSAINGKNFKCFECHIATVSAGGNQEVTGIGNHVDRLVNIKFDNNGVNKDSYLPLYNGNSTTGSAGYGKTPGTSLASCENVYCHSDGSPNEGTRIYNTIAWNGTFGGSVCAGCHGNDASEAYPTHGNAGAGAPGSNSHYKHADSSQLAIGCNECHWQTTVSNTSIANAAIHIDGDPQNVTYRVGGLNYPDGTYDTGLRQCTNTYCHGSGEPYWGGTVACGDCHKANGAVAGRHDIHFEVTATNATASDWTASRDSTAAIYKYSCGVCHQESAHSNETLYEVVMDATYAGTSTSYTAGSSMGPDPNTSYDWTDGTCATYCHSDGVSASSNTPNKAVNWNTSEGTIGCDGCHSYTAASTFVIGIDNGSTSHADHISGTIMTANGCDFCHLDTTGNGTAITDKSMHVNMAKDVVINATDFGGSWDNTKCSNVACHFDGQSGYGQPEWNNHTIGDCLGCHGGANNTPGNASTSANTTLTSAHAVHTDTGTFGYECAACHNQVVNTGSSTISNPANHINFGPANVSMAAGSWNGTNCTDACHGTASIDWSSSGTTNDCAICHGMSNDPAVGRDTNGDVSPLDLEVGAHVVHLTAANSLTGPIACSECHPVPSGGSYVANVNGHIDYTGAEFAWGTLANGTAQGGSDTNPNYTKPTCNNVYCHGVTLAGAIDNAPTWANTSYLDGGTGQGGDCNMCHGYPPFTAPGYDHKAGDTICTQCHPHGGSGAKHIDGKLEGFGEPDTSGGVCSGCHDPHWKRMNDLTGGVVYKHYMNNALANSTGSSEADYPVVSTGVMGDETDTNRSCLMCHVEHFLFNASLLGGRVREANLRVSIKINPGTGAASIANARSSGYDPLAPGGGICLSCHVNAQTKAVVGPHGEPYTLPIPYVDNDYDQQNGIANTVAPDGYESEASGGIQNAVKIVRNSTHNYAVNMDLFAGSGQYQAVCLKCHGDSLEKDKQKGGDLTNTLSLHQSSRDSLQAVMGSEPRGFFRGTVQSIGGALGNVVTLKETMTEDYSSGFALVITDSADAGDNQTFVSNRIAIDGAVKDGNTVYLSDAPGTEMGADDHYEITQLATSIAEVCFNCHSQGGPGGDGYKKADGTDFYGGLDGSVDAGDVEMQDRLESMYGLFTGANNGLVNSTVSHGQGQDDWTYWTDQVAINNSVAPNGDAANWVGYKVQFLTGAVTGQRFNIIAADGGTNECRIEPKTTSIAQNDTYKILKPAFHPLDARGVHNTMESYTAQAGWNYGNVDDAGGTRHVGCTDCHNTHASLSNPTGEGALLDFGSKTLRDPDKTYSKTEWGTDRWAGYAMIINAPDASGNNPRRMVRYIVNSTTVDSPPGSEGTTFTFATDFLENSDIPYEQAGNRYELFWHDGITGSGGKGVWGVVVDKSFLVNTPGIANSPGGTAKDWDFTKKFDTSFDVDLDTGTNGMQRGKQYMQCFRCHSYYAWSDGSGGIKTNGIPWTPSAGPAAGGGTKDWLETDILDEFNVNNYAHHAVLGVGANQPITPDGTGSYEDPTAFVTLDVDVYYVNQSWPMSSGITTDSSGISSGAVTLSSGSLPRNVLPGWYVMRDANPGEWYQIVDITDSTHFTIAETDGNPYDLNPTYPTSSGSQGLTITSGLGNTFVPPFGPWSVIRCSDCHGSTLADPVGPHASVNSWLVRDTEIDLKFEWWNGSTVDIIDYASPIDDAGNYLTDPTHVENNTKYICFNCHRADVYGSQATASGNNSPLRKVMSRINHDGSSIGVCNIENDAAAAHTTYSTWWPQFCRHCHAGDKMGGIHGTALVSGGNPNSNGAQGKRFLNGATWNGYTNLDSKAVEFAGFQCYTQGTGTDVSACTGHATGRKYVDGLNYYY